MTYPSHIRPTANHLYFLLFACLLGVSLVALASPAKAASVTPTFVSGNPTCGALLNDPGTVELKIEPVVSGTYTLGSQSVTVTVSGSSFNWTSTGTVLGVVAKGGPNANFYDYRPGGSTGDTNLTAPINPSNGNPYGLSHISFCYIPRASTDLTVSASDTTVIGGTQVTLTFSEHNDGDVALSAASVTTDNTACNGTLTGPTGDTNSNSILDPGETWVWTCTVTINANTTIVATATGTTPGGQAVTYCTNPAAPPANTICDQDERDSVTITKINPSTALSGSASATTVTSGSSVTFTFQEANDGDAALTTPTLTTDNAACNSTLTHNSGDTNANSILDPGETWVYSCTMTITATTTVVATASGIAPTGDAVTWCSDPANPPANTVCDQDERTSVTVNLQVISEGCTPGYWKNHASSWTATGYSTGQTVGSVFTGTGSLSSDSLIEALSYKGGSGVQGAMRILLRTATAAVLNAAAPGVDYSWTTAQVITAVNTALASNDRSTMLALASQLDGFNNLGCPLS